MPKHTPGPWHAVIRDEGCGVYGKATDLPGGIFWLAPSVPMADARLIAAAPDLLEAAEAAVRCLSGCGNNLRDQRALAVLQSAIRRARGEVS